MYIYIHIFVSPLEIINIPYTHGDRIHIYIYIREYDALVLMHSKVRCTGHSTSSDTGTGTIVQVPYIILHYVNQCANKLDLTIHYYIILVPV